MSRQLGPTPVDERPDDRVGRNALVIGGITMLARIAGFGRILLLTWAVGLGGVLDVYNTANRVPNILYEIVAGGALASVVVPLVAAPIARREPDVAARTASALLTWALVILLPFSAVMAMAAEPITRVLIGGHGDLAELAMGARMLRIFAPQLPLYGVGVVLTGVLHARRHFGWPALAPLLSSLTVMVAYLGYGMTVEKGLPVEEVPWSAELTLAWGTTVATVVMSLVLIIPLRRTGIRLRPTLRFSDQAVTRDVRAMATAGAVTVGAWQLSLLLALALTNGGPTGAVGIFQIALTLYMLPWGIFAMPLALSSYPELAAAHAMGDQQRFSRGLATTARRVVVLAALGAAALIGLSKPLAELFALLAAADVALSVTEAMRATLALLGPGLVGFALYPLLSRALFARQATTLAAIVTASGWTCGAAASVGLSVMLPIEQRTVAVAAGNTLGMLVMGVALLLAVAWTAGRAALSGLGRTLLASLTAAVVAASAGQLAVNAWPTTAIDSIVAILVGGAVILLSFGVVSYVINKPDVRPMLAALLRRE